MQTRLRCVTALSVLAAIIGCGARQEPLLTGDRVTTTTGARSVDALWMMALPPVVVQPVAASDTRPHTPSKSNGKASGGRFGRSAPEPTR